MKNVFGRFFGPTPADNGEQERLFRADLSFHESRSDEYLVDLMTPENRGFDLFTDYFLDAARVRSGALTLFSKEASLLERYIECYKFALGKELNVRFNVQQEADWELPAFILFPLVQNGLQHGYNSMEDYPLKITLKIFPSSLMLEVSNRVNHYINSQQTGQRIENYKARLSACYPDRHFLLFNSNSRTFKSTLTIKIT
ncbi:hypothetical protein HP439_17895 [Sphingobacterium shayense]|uniref:hypothetical protein n=1 Tax=Sphingobacterium shayense TaxID=626343 RepID=UPI001555F8FC|nr:hypothetical protein [Sphingobacterium shayense]NQD72601.1 hypothetical protein [Sphingobacterium shayense]